MSRNCTKTKRYYYCKGMHNTDICNDRNKQGNQTPTLCITCFVYFVTNCRYYLRKLKCCVRHLFVFPQKNSQLRLQRTTLNFEGFGASRYRFWWWYRVVNRSIFLLGGKNKVGEPVGVKIKFHLVFKWTPTKATECFDKS